MNRTEPPIDPSAGPPAILIRDYGACANIHPARLEMFEDLLVERQSFLSDGRGGLRRETKPEHLFDLDAQGSVNVPAGLVPRLAAAARRAGYRVDIQDHGEPPSAAPAPDLVGAIDNARLGLAESLARSRRGVIEVCSAQDKPSMIELVARVFTSGPIAIVTKSRREAIMLNRRLATSLREPVHCCTRGRTGSDGRIRVGTIRSLDLTVAGVVFFVDATQILHEDVPDRLMTLRRQRIYGLLGDTLPLSRRQRLVIEAFGGPVIGRLGPPGERPADVRVAFASWPGKDQPDEPLGLVWKRQSIWHNTDRNAAITRVTEALAGDDLATLWKYGLFLEDEDDLRHEEPRRVVVLVESLEHGRELGRLLPGWRLLQADEACLAESNGHEPAGATPVSRHARPDRVIMTMASAHGLADLETDIIIRADGTPWPLELSLASGRSENTEEQAVLLVDFADDQDRTARDATRARRLDYRDRDWLSEKGPANARGRSVP
ncbi:MAG: hypothetical protein ACLQGP_41205 [Isosphaeraceae bacterium]